MAQLVTDAATLTARVARSDQPERRATRTPPTTPRPRVVTRPDGTRAYPDPVTYWPYPPPGRPRFAHHRLSEELHGTSGITYRTYARETTVVAYGRVSDHGADDADWAVTVWDAHPLLTPRRAHLVRYLVDNATYAEALAALDTWELNGAEDEQ